MPIAIPFFIGGLSGGGSGGGTIPNTAINIPSFYDPVDPGIVAAGVAATPSLSFQADRNTGFYRSAENQIGVAVNGLQALNIAEGELELFRSGTLARFTAIGSGGATASGRFQGQSSRGTIAAPTATLSGDDIAYFGGVGYGATDYGSVNTGVLKFQAAENFTDSAQGTYATIWTTPTGSVTRAERMRIDAAGNLGFHFGTMLGWQTSGAYRALQLGGFGGLHGQSAGPDISILQNVYWDGSQYTYSSSAAVGRLTLSSGSLTFLSADSGTVGNAATVSGRLHISNAHNHGISYGTMRAWNTASDYRGIQIGSYGGIMYNLGAPTLSFAEGAYFGSSGWRLANTGTGRATWLELLSGNVSIYGTDSLGANETAPSWSARFVINTFGNVKFGPSSWLGWLTSGSYKAIQIGPAGGVLFHTTGTDLNYSQNAYFDGTDWKRSQAAATVKMNLAGGEFKVDQAGSGAADAVASYVNSFIVNTNRHIVTGGGTAGGTEAGAITVYGGANAGKIYAGGNASMYINWASNEFHIGRESGFQATYSGSAWSFVSAEFAEDGSRRKQHVRYLDPADSLAAILKVRTREYVLVGSASKKHEIGFFAENLHEASPLLSNGRTYDGLTVDSFLIGSVQALEARIADLEKQLAARRN